MEYEYNYAEPELSPIGQRIESFFILPRLFQFGIAENKLNDFYKKNGITSKNNDIKNHMRHMGGSALFASPNWLGSPESSKFWGNVKEARDILTRDSDDTEQDLINNQIGRNIAKQYPNLNSEEHLQKVYEEVLRRYKTNQL